MNDSDSVSASSRDNGLEKGRFLALDIGDKRIGMAMSDPLGITAQGLPTISRRGKKHDLNVMVSIIEKYGVTRIIYGLPKNMDGTLGSQAQKTEKFITQLRSRIPCLFIPWDERLTSLSAHQILKESGMSRKDRSKNVDMLSAVLILQNYLDHYRNSGEKR